MADEIIQLLENDKLRQEVITAIQKVWSFAGTLYDNPDEDMEKYVEENKEASLWEEAWWRAETFGEIHKIEQAFDEYVIRKMAKPHRLTLEELVEAFFNLAKPVESHSEEFDGFSSDDLNNLYAIFVNYIKNHILSYRYSDPFPICLVTEEGVGKEWFRGAMSGYALAMKHMGRKDFPPTDASDAEDDESEKPLWSKNGISVSLSRGADVIDARPAGKKLYQILAFIEGNISTLACSKLRAEMSHILPSAIRSADLLQAERFGSEYKVIEPKIHLLFKIEIKGLPWGDEKLIENGKPFIRQYLDAYYSEATKKDSFDRRIRNAVCLLIESDDQANNAVGLALSIDAIDALLGEKGPEATVRLADNVAALLEPDTTQRNNATEFVKKLYDTRSDVLHGRAVETEREARLNARHLAAATLSSIISLRIQSRSGFEPETPQELLQKLRERRFQPGQPLGVDEYNVCELWRNKATGKKDGNL